MRSRLQQPCGLLRLDEPRKRRMCCFAKQRANVKFKCRGFGSLFKALEKFQIATLGLNLERFARRSLGAKI
jgi:hypothetical protein